MRLAALPVVGLLMLSVACARTRADKGTFQPASVIDHENRPSFSVCGGDIDASFDHVALEGPVSFERLHSIVREVAPSVGKFGPDGATGFVIADGLILTNKHVAANIGPDSYISFDSGACDEETTHTYRVRDEYSVIFAKNFDAALVAVESDDHFPPALDLDFDNSILESNPTDQSIVVVGHPILAQLPEDTAVFGQRLGSKMASPGMIRRREVATDQIGTRSMLRHDASTLPGSSGSPVVDVKTSKILGLHFAGLGWAGSGLNAAESIAAIFATDPVLSRYRTEGFEKLVQEKTKEIEQRVAEQKHLQEELRKKTRAERRQYARKAGPNRAEQIYDELAPSIGFTNACYCPHFNCLAARTVSKQGRGACWKTAERQFEAVRQLFFEECYRTLQNLCSRS